MSGYYNLFDRDGENITVNARQLATIGAVLMLDELGAVNDGFREFCKMVGVSADGVSDALTQIRSMAKDQDEYAAYMETLQSIYDLTVYKSDELDAETRDLTPKGYAAAYLENAERERGQERADDEQ